ncbi:MAG: lipoprotein-releasing system ATP-binding protein LolD [Myxococcales bacterium]|nr:lipoprotein-releasing system ATP-binding protein LolD [Myxococcales bacterium]
MTLLLHADGVEKYFLLEEQKVEVLKGLSLKIGAGERVAIVGSSGAGKSTLLHLLGALDLPSSGEIYFMGEALSNKSHDELARFRNRQLGFIFQFHHLLKELTALENVMMPALIARNHHREAKQRAMELLERVGLAHRLDHRPAELSGGEQQRVSLARALINRPPLLLADEPTGNLDGVTSSEIHDLLNEINREDGTALVIVTHSEQLAQSMPRRLHIVDGKLDQDERDLS